MSDLPQVKRNIQIEEVRYRAAITESMGQKLGSSINFINERQYDSKMFCINGRYAELGTGNGVDGFQFALVDVEVVDAFCWNRDPGTSGTTTLDIKVKDDPSAGAWNSLFTTLPVFTSGASSFVWNSTTIAAPNTTQPILNSTYTNVDAGAAFRIDLISSMGGTPRNCGVCIMFRPR